MNARCRLHLVLTSALLTCGGCHSYEAENALFPPPSDQPAPRETWDEAMAYARCSLLERCRGVGLQSGYVGQEPCVDHFARVYRFELEADLDAGTLTWDEAGMGRCLAAHATTACAQARLLDPPCVELMGAVPEGEPCRRDTHCVAGAYCDEEHLCPGVCRPGRPAGADCDVDRECEAGVPCNGGRCSPDRAEGEVCDRRLNECGPGLSCVEARCVRAEPLRFGRGETCFVGFARYEPCSIGTRCAPAQLTGGDSAEEHCLELQPDVSCVRGRSRATEACPIEQRCDAPVPFSEGRCVARLAVGEPCDRHRDCALGLGCDSDGRCSADGWVRPIDAGCSVDFECAAGICGFFGDCYQSDDACEP